MAKVEGVPDVVVDGEVIEADPPRRLVQTWRMLMDADLKAEGFTRLTHEIEPIEGGVTKLTIIHELEEAPKLAALVGGEHESRGRGRRLELGAQRPQDRARDRRRARPLTSRVAEAPERGLRR